MGGASPVEGRKGTQGRGWAEASRKEAAKTESFLSCVDGIIPDSSEILTQYQPLDSLLILTNAQELKGQGLERWLSG